MIIEWHQNPLKTTVKLTPEERTIFLLRAKIKDFEDAARMAAFYLDEKGKEKGRYSPEKALSWIRSQLDGKSNENDPEESGGAAMLRAVECQEHLGDCVCVATTCDKCMGEDLLSVNTIEGLSQHGRAKLRGAYGENGDRPIDEVIDALKNYQPSKIGHWETIDADKFESYAVQWRAEAREAHDWLVRYKATKLTRTSTNEQSNRMVLRTAYIPKALDVKLRENRNLVSGSAKSIGEVLQEIVYAALDNLREEGSTLPKVPENKNETSVVRTIWVSDVRDNELKKHAFRRGQTRGKLIIDMISSEVASCRGSAGPAT